MGDQLASKLKSADIELLNKAHTGLLIWIYQEHQRPAK